MVTLTVSEVAELNVVEFTVIPEPENDTAAPDKKFVPVIVKCSFDVPRLCELGLTEVTVGAPFTVNPAFSVTPLRRCRCCPRSRHGRRWWHPSVRVTLTVSWVDELNVVEFTVIPVPENDTAAPDTNPVPVIVKFWFDAP